jgi:hypothetical protein
LRFFAFERRVNALCAELRAIEARIGAGEKIGRTRVSASRARELHALRHHASLVADRLRAARPPAAPGNPRTT